MTKTVAKKDLYRNLREVSEDVMRNSVVYTVLQNSKPAFYIVPIAIFSEKKYKKEDLMKFVFKSKDRVEKNLALSYKNYLYSFGLFSNS